jgi:hypothetical protein
LVNPRGDRIAFDPDIDARSGRRLLSVHKISL